MMSLSVYGEMTRNIAHIWKEICDKEVFANEDQIFKIFARLGLYPSSAQVGEMIHVSRECSNREAGLGLSFGDVSLCATELKKHYEKEIPRSSVLSKPTEKSSLDRKRPERKSSKPSSSSSPKYEVFLGGSCNTTTWRQELAIPVLKSHGISFYNPQVTHWEEALIELEYQAKQTASVLFFVFDTSTRNVASMVEAGYMSGCNRKLVLVVNKYSGPGQLINGEPISHKEYLELISGLHTVQDLVEKQGIPVFSEIKHALTCIAKILKGNMCPQDLTSEDVRPVKFPHIQVGDIILKSHDAFANADADKISLEDIKVAYRVIAGKDLTQEEIQTILAGKKGVPVNELDMSKTPLNDIMFTFEEFCSIVAEFKYPKLERQKVWELVQSLLHKFVDITLPRRQLHVVGISGTRDVYLGGSVGSKVTWREDIAIPLLMKHGLSFFNLSTTSGRLFPMEAAAIECSRVLLFVITNNTRAAAAMALAAYYIGYGCTVVLCVQTLEKGAVIEDEELTSRAISDYNRGRLYLTDQANKDGVPVFANVQEAMECVIQKCLAR